MSAVGRVIRGLQSTYLLRIQARGRRQLLKGADGLRDGLLQLGELVLAGLEVNRGRGDDLVRIHKGDLRREATTHEQDTGAGEVGHVRGDEEARQRERAAGHAREEDVGRVERDHLREDLLHEVVDSLHVGDAVGSVEAGWAAGRHPPEELLGGGEDHDAHQALLHGLVREVEEGLSAVAMEQNIQATGPSGAGLLGGACDAGRRCELVGGSGDLEAKAEAAERCDTTR